jgi:hypothetical protein
MKATHATIAVCLLAGIGPISLAHSAEWSPPDGVGHIAGGQAIAADVGRDGRARIAWAGREPAGVRSNGAWVAEYGLEGWRRQLVLPTSQVPFVALRDDVLAATVGLFPQPYATNVSTLQLSTRSGSSWSAPRVIAPNWDGGFVSPKIGIGSGRKFVMGRSRIIEADASPPFAGVRTLPFQPNFLVNWSLRAEAATPTAIWGTLGGKPITMSSLRADGQWAPAVLSGREWGREGPGLSPTGTENGRSWRGRALAFRPAHL